MKKIFLTFLCMLIAMQSITAANSIYIDDVEAKPGDIVTLSVQMTNTETDKYCGFQFDVVLPEGMSFVQNDGFYEAALSTQRTTARKTNFFDSVLQSDGSLRILCNTSASNSEVGHLYCFSGTLGEVCTIKVKVDENIKAGKHSIVLKNIALSDYSSVSHAVSDYTMELKVPSIEVTSVSLNKATLEMVEGDTENLTATVMPANATEQGVTWTSSNGNVATVDAQGKVTAVAEGTAIITATSVNGKTAQCAVVVSKKANPVTAITLNKTTLRLTEGENEILTVTYTPENADGRSVTWTSSNGNVATVDAQGKVTAVAEGTAIITATSVNGKTAQCAVVVSKKANPVTAITLNKTTLRLTEGENEILTVTYTPEDADGRSVTWTSSDNNVATVDANGKVTAIGVGTAIITATSANGKTAQCSVAVAKRPNPVTTITLNKTTLNITEGDSETLTVTYAPEDADDRSVTWTSSDTKIATVDANGKVTAIGVGTAIITATSMNGKTAQCAVVVSKKANPVTAITLNKTTLQITEGDSETLTVTYTPADADDRSVTWTSSNGNVATVDAQGKVTAVAEGTAIITATSVNGKTAQCVVIVEKDTENISFADPNVKAVCIEKWDTDGNGKLSYAEAAAVSSIGEIFGNNDKIRSFEELQYFTGLTEIGERAFRNCSSLASVTIPNSVTKIGDSAFYSCSSLSTINIPGSVTTIDNAAFASVPGFSGMINIYVDNSNANYCSVDGVLFSHDKKVLVAYPDGRQGAYTIPDGVIEIGCSAFSGCCGLTSVLIPESVTKIDHDAFYFCSELHSLTLPERLTSIGYAAFTFCTGLTSITIPSSVTNMEYFVFDGCTGLTSMIVDSDNPRYDSRGNCNAIIETSTNSLVYGCKSTVIPNGVTSIGWGAFRRNTSLTAINIPNSVNYVDHEVFQGCEGLTSVTIGNRMIDISNSAFEWCTSLTSVTIMQETPPSFHPFPNESNATLYVPYGCKAKYEAADYWKNFKKIEEMESRPVTSIALNKTTLRLIEGENETLTVTYSPEDADGKSVTWTSSDDNVAKVDAQGKVTAVAEGVVIVTATTTNGKIAQCVAIVENDTENISFADPNVKAVCIENWDTDGNGKLSYAEAAAVSSLDEVFRDNKSITSFEELQYFTGLTEIGNDAFSGCEELTSVIIPDNVTRIGEGAFWCDRKLTSVNIPKNVKSIEFGAFFFCHSLSSVTFPQGLESIASWAFYACNLDVINIPSSVTKIGTDRSFPDNSPSSIIVEDGNPVYDSRNNCNAIIETRTNTLLVGSNNTIIPDDITYIGSWAFSGCDKIKTIKIPNSVTCIDTWAFTGCKNMDTITIPNSVTVMKGAIFYGCRGLTSVSLPNSITKIDDNTFQGCESLTSITIPGSVATIVHGAFEGCNNLTSITVLRKEPAAIETANAFSNYDATLYVPYGCKSKYEEADYWKDFKEIVEIDFIKGDVNGDDNVTMADANMVVNYFLATDKPEDFNVEAADVNGDGDITMADANMIVNMFLNGTTTEVTNKHEAVNLGLSVKWATCNVGANSPEEFGDYFAWGETEPKETYSWESYKWCSGSEATLTKYNANSYYGTVDNRITLESADDAATVKWGGLWRMPTYKEQAALRDSCYWEWTTNYNGKGVSGYIVYKAKAAADRGLKKHIGSSTTTSASYSLSDAHIFLPAAGNRDGTYLNNVGTTVHFWSSSLYENNPNNAWYVRIDSVNYRTVFDYDNHRYYGFSVRPVFSEKHEDKHEAVDLGLSVKWATCNVGAENPQDYGDYFAWGETEPKDDYDWPTYKWCNGSRYTQTKYNTNSDYGTVDNRTTLEPADDAATVNWGGSWRTPTFNEQEELRDKCYWEWTTNYNGKEVSGYIVYKAKAEADKGVKKYSSKNVTTSATYSLSDNHIFLPAAGYRGNWDAYYTEQNGGYYWSDMVNPDYDAYNLFICPEDVRWRNYDRSCGQSIRPVCP